MNTLNKKIFNISIEEAAIMLMNFGHILTITRKEQNILQWLNLKVFKLPQIPYHCTITQNPQEQIKIFISRECFPAVQINFRVKKIP